MITLPRLRRRPAAPVAPPTRLLRAPVPEVAHEPHGVARPEVLAAIRARAEHEHAATDVLTAAPTLPFAAIPAPETESTPFFDALGGGRLTTRTCGYCGAAHDRGDLSWRYDALTRWSCPGCQLLPGWHAPRLPGLRVTTPEGNPGGEEMGIMARSLLGANPRPVRQRPDGLWMAAIPIEGRIKRIGPFRYQADAEEVYATFLGAATQAAEVSA